MGKSDGLHGFIINHYHVYCHKAIEPVMPFLNTITLTNTGPSYF